MTVYWNMKILDTESAGVVKRSFIFIQVGETVVYRVGILGQLFGTPPELLEHHPIKPWGILGQHHPNFWNTTPFWDNFLEHHPNFWNTIPFWDNFLEHHPNFWNTTPSRILRQLFGTPPHRRNNENTNRPG